MKYMLRDQQFLDFKCLKKQPRKTTPLLVDNRFHVFEAKRSALFQFPLVLAGCVIFLGNSFHLNALVQITKLTLTLLKTTFFQITKVFPNSMF